jgi:aldehyde:ferredoxin oxidoreductase
LNLRRGLSRENDRLPKLLFQPLDEGGTEGRVPDLEALLVGAYQEFGWDTRTGRPLPETLEQLGLDDGRRTFRAMTTDGSSSPP